MIHVYTVHPGNISKGRFWFSRSDAGPKTLHFFLPPFPTPSLPPFLLFFLSSFFFFLFLDIGSFIFKPHTDRAWRAGWLDTGPKEACAHELSSPAPRDKTSGWPGLLSIRPVALPTCPKGRLATLGCRLRAPPTVGGQLCPEPLINEGLHFCTSFWSLNCSVLDIRNRFCKSLVRSSG